MAFLQTIEQSMTETIDRFAALVETLNSEKILNAPSYFLFFVV